MPRLDAYGAVAPDLAQHGHVVLSGGPGRGNGHGRRSVSRYTDRVPPMLCAEIEREGARLKVVKEQVRAVEAARRNGRDGRRKSGSPCSSQMPGLPIARPPCTGRRTAFRRCAECDGRHVDTCYQAPALRIARRLPVQRGPRVRLPVRRRSPGRRQSDRGRSPQLSAGVRVHKARGVAPEVPLSSADRGRCSPRP
jgi:hypothetical protein